LIDEGGVENHWGLVSPRAAEEMVALKIADSVPKEMELPSETQLLVWTRDFQLLCIINY
jgi:hypothetical protein